jgi:uncharacterized membrane protein YphA (DoxX/SURF4 family)
MAWRSVNLVSSEEVFTLPTPPVSSAVESMKRDVPSRGGEMAVWMLVARFVLGAIFLTAGVAKIAHRDDFADAVRNYRLLGDRPSDLFAAWIPPLEIVCGLFLGFGLLVGWVSLLLVGLLLTFSAGVAINLRRGRSIDCGCLGVSATKDISWATVGRNLVLAAAAASLIVSSGSPWLRLSWQPTGPESVGSQAALAAFIMTTTALLGLLLARDARRLLGALSKFPSKGGDWV